MHRAEQLLALLVEPDDQRRHAELRLSLGRVLGRIAGVADAPRRRERLRDPDGLLHPAVLRERRLHRRFTVQRQHGRQRLAAAVACPQQRARRLDERRLEPGLLRRRGRPGGVLPCSGVLRRALHQAFDEPGDARGAVPVRRLCRKRERLRALGADELVRDDLGRRRDTGDVDPDQPLLRRQAVGLRRDDQRGAWHRPEPDPDAGRLPPRPEHLRQTPRHDRARTRLPDADPDEWQCGHDDRARKGNHDLGRHLRRGAGQLAGAAESRERSRKKRRRVVRPVDPERRLLPHRRRGAGQRDDQPRRQQRQRHPGRHLGLAGRPR